MGEKPTPMPRLKTPNLQPVTQPVSQPFVSRMSTTEEVRNRRKEYMIKKDFKIFCGSWNVDSLTPINISLKNWLRTVEDTPDFYVIGFQELDMNADTILWGDTRVMRPWVDRILEDVHSGAEYEELQSVRFVGMQLTVLVKKELNRGISECMTAMIARGALNVYGNKGGIGISFCFNENLFCFVNAHFAAHQHEYEKRNEDFQEITNRMLFFEDGCKTRRILDHDHIFWLGDLNYRVEIKEFPDSNYKYTDFSAQDQLYIARRDKKAFAEYQEGKIGFPPTYKFKDSVTYDRLRVPSWCDRILWKSDTVFQTLYDSVPSISLSDHKPVFAYFLATLDIQDQDKLRRVVGEVLRTNDKRENDLVPMLKVLPKDINFGIVKTNDTVATTLELCNTGFIPVVFQLKNKSNETDDSLPSWLNVSDKSSCIPPGQRFNVTFTAKVDHFLANLITNKYKNNPTIRKIPVDIIIMHIVQGCDIFLTIYFELLPSCFGVTFTQMCKMPKPLAKYHLHDLLQETDEEKVILRRKVMISGMTRESPVVNRKIPIEIFRLIDFLYKERKMTKKLLLTAHKTTALSEFEDVEINVIRDYLDNWGGGPFPGTPDSAFWTLIKILETSPVPLLTISDREIIATNNRFDLAKDLIMHKVCPLHRRIFLYLCLFIQDMRTANNDKSTDLNIALIFARVLIREENQSGALVTANALTYNLNFLERKRKFLLQFFTNEPPMDWVQKELFKP